MLISTPPIPIFNPVDKSLLDEVAAVFDGKTQNHSIPCSQAGTPFQHLVWKTIQSIPYGKTITYTQLAELIGKPTSFRAVANACGQNNIAVLVPCHRVVRADGGLGGYRWGIKLKEKLLAREH